MRQQAGFTLVEVLIAVALIALVLTPFLGVVMRGQFFNQEARLRTAAAHLAQEKMEDVDRHLTSLSELQLPTGANEYTYPPAGDPARKAGAFTWHATITKVKPDDEVDLYFYQITINIQWAYRGRTHSYEVSTYGRRRP